MGTLKKLYLKCQFAHETNEVIEIRKINELSLSESVNPNNDVEFDTKKSPEVENCQVELKSFDWGQVWLLK